MNYLWVSSQDELSAAIEACSQGDWVAVDTEFMRTDTYYPKVGLLQLGTPQDNFLIDPLAISDVSPIVALLEDSSVLKVLHSGSEDFEVFRRWLSVSPAPVFDTQVAAAALGYGYAMGYQKLIETMMNETIPKGETRSDWLQRPLTASQCAYAAQDVHYLAMVFPRMLSELDQLERRSWVLQDSVPRATLPTMVPVEDAYKRQKGLHLLSPRALLLAQQLFEWREREARRKDRPRNRILHDEQIMNLVRAPDRSWRDLKQAGFHNRTRQRIGDDVLALVDQALATAASDLPAPLDGKRIPVDKKQYKELQAALGELAQSLKVPVEYAATRRDLEHIVRARSRNEVSLPATFSGWREVHIGPALLNAC